MRIFLFRYRTRQPHETNPVFQTRPGLCRFTRFHVAEVEDAIRTCAWAATELGRLDCRKDFAYGLEWNGKVYATKQVRPVFVDETGEIVVITVYTYYF